MEKYSLKWDNFQNNISKSFQKLRNEEDFFDVTLVGDDGTHVMAHKLLLASSSEYFKNVFIYSKKYFLSHALICLEGLQQNDLNNILEYIYQGEVQIHQQDLDRFLALAQRLKLEGLIGGEQEKEAKEENNFPDEMTIPETSGEEQNEDKQENYIKEEIIEPENYFQEDMNVEVTPMIATENENQKNELRTTKVSLSLRNEAKVIRSERKKEKPVITIQSSEIHSLEELDQKVEESYSKDTNGFFSCHHCSRSFRQRNTVKEHVEIHFDNLSFPCSLCDKIIRTRNALRVHKMRHHSNQV